MKTTQKGFTIVEILLIILVAAVVGLGGYYVWHNQHNKDSKTTASTSAAKSATNSTQNYVNITEWGARAPYSGSLSLSYAIGKGSDSNYSHLFIKRANSS